MPGMLRIDITPIDSGRAMVFRNDSLYIFRNGTLARALPYVHPLMVLGSDIYSLPPARTLDKLRTLRFDLSKLSRATWNDRAVYVVGAATGDTTSAQFWVDRERLQVAAHHPPPRPIRGRLLGLYGRPPRLARDGNASLAADR